MHKVLLRKLSEKSTSSLDILSALATEVNKHSLLDSLYIYKHSKNQYGYILQDKKTSDIVAIDCGDYKSQRFNIESLMKKTGGGFVKLLLTSDLPHSTNGIQDWKRVHPELEIIKAGVKEEGHIEYLGDLCIYCMHTPGSSEKGTSYIVTEVNESSTKTPIAFTGDVLTTGGCGKTLSYEAMYQSLMKLKYLPNETLVFPGFEMAAENLMFAKIIDTKNEFVNGKLEEVKEGKIKSIGQFMSQEKLYNPFLRCDQKYFHKIFEVEDNLSCFVKMKKMMEKLLQNQEH